jgi:hypothetical protein
LAATFLGEALLKAGVAMRFLEPIEVLISIGLFGLGMRSIPLAGIHAAEHKVVHAIERGEDLDPEVVRRMPRVHPRCGTNLAVGGMLFLGLGSAAWIPDQTLRLMVAILATLLLWRRLGALVQRWITTSNPNEKQLMMGIRSGRELLDRYAHARTAMPSIGQRIWNSGMFQVVAGSFAMYLFIYAVSVLFPGLNLPIE